MGMIWKERLRQRWIWVLENGYNPKELWAVIADRSLNSGRIKVTLFFKMSKLDIRVQRNKMRTRNGTQSNMYKVVPKAL